VEIQRECEKSLKRLQTDEIDLYYAHRDDHESRWKRSWRHLIAWLKAGKVRAIGASNLSLWRIAEANAISQIHKWSGYVCSGAEIHLSAAPPRS